MVAQTPDSRPELLVVADAAAWRSWLDFNEHTHEGVWLVLAKKGTLEPTSLSYAQALEEALCSGWIDGQKKSHNQATFLQRFTPRRARSMWSTRNIGLAESLESSGRMRERGALEIAKAQADGRWDRAYAGSATVEVPVDLMAALALSPVAEANFEALNRSNRYSVLHPIITAPSSASRARRITKWVGVLERGELQN